MSQGQEFPAAVFAVTCLEHSLALNKYTLGIEQMGPREIEQFTDAHGTCKGAELGTDPRLFISRTQALKWAVILR